MEGIQYSGGYLQSREDLASVLWRTVEGIQYSGGYLQYSAELASVLWGIASVP